MQKQFKKGTKIRPAFCAHPYPLSAYQGKQSGTAAAFLHGYQECAHGKGLRGAVLVPQNHQEYERFDWKWAKEALKRERKYWAGVDLQKIKMQVPDEALMDMVSAAARNMLQAREVKDGIVEFQVGACHYRSLWVIDGYFMLEAARYLGYHKDADQGVAALLRRARKDGSITQLSFHMKETSIAVATLVRYAELTDDWDGLRGYWPIIQKAVEYIKALRAEACAYSPSHPAYRLMPESFGDGGLGGGRAEYTTPCWTLVGLCKAAEAARHLGLDEDAEAFQASFEHLKKDFHFRAGQTMKRLPDGLPYLPMWISGGDHMHGADGPVPIDLRLKPAGGTWAFCQTIYPGEIFAPDDPLVQNFLALLDRIDDAEGIPVETGWMPHQGLWTYYASFAAHAWLYGGRPDKAVDYLYAFANHAAPTRVWREEQSLKDSRLDLWWGDMPHNWASAEFIRLVRNLLVLERSGGLDLLYGLPSEWLASGAGVILEKTPTRFGPISLRTKQDSQGRITMDVEQSNRWSVQAKEVRLHLPKSVLPSSVKCNGKAVPTEGGVVHIKPGAAKTRLQAKVRKRRA